jgi:hypothetical protein
MAKKMIPRLTVALLATLATQSAMADKIGLVSVTRMTYDSDTVFLGHAIEQTKLSEGFVFIDTDQTKKKLDVAIFTFLIDEPFKGANSPPVQVCTILNPQKYTDIEVGKTYVLFLQRTGKYLQRTYGSLSQIEIDDGKVETNLFPSSYKDIKSFDSLIAVVRDASTHHNKRLRSTPYNPYANALYKILENPCAVS